MRCLVSALLGVLFFTLSAAQADITIGIVGPMTGSEAAFGEQFKHGAEQAALDLNAAGGVMGQKLKLLIMDSACDPKQSVSVANEMVARGVAFVAGDYCSGSTLPASDVYAEAGLLQITPGSTDPKITERGLTNIFRICGRNDSQAKTAAAYALAHFPKGRIAIVHDKSAYGKTLAEEFQKAANALGIKEIMFEAITAGEKDYSALVSKLKDIKADYLYFGGYKTEGGLVVRQMRAQGLKTILMGGDSLVTGEFWGITGAAGEGTLMTFGNDPRLLPANKPLVEKFRAEKYEPESYTLYMYAAIQAWASAVKAANSLDGAKVADSLRANQHDTVLGRVGFDKKGDVSLPGFAMYHWTNGKYETMP